MSAVGDTTVILLEIDKVTRPCHKVCAAHLQVVRSLLAIMSQKAFALKQKIRILSQRTIRARLMLFLQIRAKRAKSNEFEIPFDRQALADYLCVDRSALSAELSKLRKERLVESVKNKFKLLAS
jgi:CRP-like cAMP-binding protein